MKILQVSLKHIYLNFDEFRKHRYFIMKKNFSIGVYRHRNQEVLFLKIIPCYQYVNDVTVTASKAKSTIMHNITCTVVRARYCPSGHFY